MIYASKNNDVGSKQLLILIGSDMFLIHFSSMFQKSENSGWKRGKRLKFKHSTATLFFLALNTS